MSRDKETCKSVFFPKDTRSLLQQLLSFIRFGSLTRPLPSKEVAVPFSRYKAVNGSRSLPDNQSFHRVPPYEHKQDQKDDPAYEVGEQIKRDPPVFVADLKRVGLIELDARAMGRSYSHRFWAFTCARNTAH